MKSKRATPFIQAVIDQGTPVKFFYDFDGLMVLMDIPLVITFSEGGVFSIIAISPKIAHLSYNTRNCYNGISYCHINSCIVILLWKKYCKRTSWNTDGS